MKYIFILLIFGLVLPNTSLQAQSDVFGDTDSSKIPFNTSTLISTTTIFDDEHPTSTIPTFIANPIPADINQEISEDEVNAQDLGIADPTVLPGEPGYWWQNFKRQLRISFTFNAEKRAQAILDDANVKLIEAKKLAEKTNDPQAAERIAQALQKYTARVEELKEKLQALPENDRVLENLDRNFLAHQQLLRNLSEKLPGAQDEIERTRTATAQEWLDANRARIKERLEKAIQNSDGSKFVQIQNLSTVERLSETLPVVSAQIAEARQAALEKLKQDLADSTPEDRDKIDTYLEKLNIDQISKQRILDQLSSSELPIDIRLRLQQVKERDLEALRARWENMQEEQKNAILEKLDKIEADPTSIRIISELRDSANQVEAEALRTILQNKSETLKQQIRNEVNAEKLNTLETKLRQLPALRLEIRDRQAEINSDKVIFIPGPNATSTLNATSTIFDGNKQNQKIQFRANQ